MKRFTRLVGGVVRCFSNTFETFKRQSLSSFFDTLEMFIGQSSSSLRGITGNIIVCKRRNKCIN